MFLDFIPLAIFGGLSLTVGGMHVLTGQAARRRPTAKPRPSAQIIAFVPRQSPVGSPRPQARRAANGG